jgi:hypothetical protein
MGILSQVYRGYQDFQNGRLRKCYIPFSHMGVALCLERFQGAERKRQGAGALLQNAGARLQAWQPVLQQEASMR